MKEGLKSSSPDCHFAGLHLLPAETQMQVCLCSKQHYNVYALMIGIGS